MMDSLDPGVDVPWQHSATAFAIQALARLRPLSAPSPSAPPRSDYDLNPGLVPPADTPLKPAAVLIPIVARPNLTVLLTQRTASLARHAGQIAFPGGRIEPDDASPAAAALREAHEEIGLDPTLVNPLGFLDTYRSSTGYLIEPLVALVNPAHTLTLDPGEVAEAFEVPLAFLLDARNRQTHSRLWQGAERHFYAIPYETRYIWGVTAGIFANMHERLNQP